MKGVLFEFFIVFICDQRFPLGVSSALKGNFFEGKFKNFPNFAFYDVLRKAFSKQERLTLGFFGTLAF